MVNQLKTHFQRLRPSDILNTYAFPSGHTTAAVFIMGKPPTPWLVFPSHPAKRLDTVCLLVLMISAFKLYVNLRACLLFTAVLQLSVWVL